MTTIATDALTFAEAEVAGLAEDLYDLEHGITDAAWWDPALEKVPGGLDIAIGEARSALEQARTELGRIRNDTAAGSSRETGTR